MEITLSKDQYVVLDEEGNEVCRKIKTPKNTAEIYRQLRKKYSRIINGYVKAIKKI